MDWRLNLLLFLALMPFVHCWSAIPSTRSINSGRQRNEVSPYLDLVLCPIREQPWSCARQQSARLLDVWDNELRTQWQKLKVEADRQLNSTLEKRGYSSSAFITKEKPSTILKKIEIGTDYMKEYLAETMDGFLGREYEYTLNTKNNEVPQNDQEDEEDEEPAEEQDDEEEEEDDEVEEDDNEDEEEGEDDNEVNQTGGLKNTNLQNSNVNDDGDEFIEIEENQEVENEELKKPGNGGFNKRKKQKNKKKGNQHDLASQPANLLVIQPIEHQLAQQHDDHETTHKVRPVRTKGKPGKQKKRKRRKKKGDHGSSTIVVEQEPSSDSFGLGLLEELASFGDDSGAGGKRKKHPMKYGRSNGVTRGKKKKKKKALMKLMLLGSFLKAKIELLLKLLGAHLQIKFFAIALIGLLINIARFWIDVKRGGVPQKVVYVEHAHHQHHYEDHGDEWSESGGGGGGGGGYWKRSLQTDSTENTYDTATDSYQLRPQLQQQQQSQQYQQQQQQQQYDPQYMAYRNQWQRK